MILIHKFECKIEISHKSSYFDFQTLKINRYK